MVKVGAETQFIYSDKELAKLIKDREKELGVDLEIREETDKTAPQPGHDVDMVEFFEAEELEKIVAGLEKSGFALDEDYAPQEKDTLIQKSKSKRVSAPEQICKLKADGETAPIFSLQELLGIIKKRAKKGMTVQRYKGLGEMNPGQLWETTMDPARRTLLKVVLEDAVKTDEMFTVLMGDQVEPRREFIKKHAREVTNLDI